MREAIHYLAQEIGQRFAGSPEERRAAEYMAGRFRALGLPTELQAFGFIGWVLDQWPVLEILSPPVQEIAAAPLLYAGPTPPAGLSGRLVPRGVTSLVPGVMDMPIYDVVGGAGERLASVIIEIHGPAIPLINPRPMLQLPEVVVGVQDRKILDARLAQGPVQVHLTLQSHLAPATAYNVICHAVNPRAGRRLVVSAHLDTTLNTPGAYDNASGLAGLLEIAKAAPTLALQVADGLDLIAFACEEVGFWGSTYYVNDLQERGLLAGVKACLTLDMISGGDELWAWAGPADFRHRVGGILATTRAAARYPLKVSPAKPGGDDWTFQTHGIPGAQLLLWRQPDYHKPTDTADRVDWQRISDVVDAALDLIRQI
jgi:aminopeptidase YwaD